MDWLHFPAEPSPSALRWLHERLGLDPLALEDVHNGHQRTKLDFYDGHSFMVVSVPMLVDRDVTTPQALRTSIRAVSRNPVTMTAWALFILLASGFSVATMMLGFIVLYPVMGHASWHLYRDVVDTSGIPLRKRAG